MCLFFVVIGVVIIIFIRRIIFVLVGKVIYCRWGGLRMRIFLCVFLNFVNLGIMCKNNKVDNEYFILV